VSRSMEEVLNHHNRAVLSDDYDEMIADYTDDAILITLKGTFVGKEAIGRALRQLIRDMPNMRGVESKRNAMIVEGDTLLLRWSAESDTGIITDAVDTIVLKEDKIWRQTTTFEIVSR
jgi:ketosteroid isomerase-like protein